MQPWLLTWASISKLENNKKIGVRVVVWVWVWVWLCGCGCGCDCVGVGVLVRVHVISMIQNLVLLQHLSVSLKVKSNLSHDRRILMSCLTCCAVSSLIANSFHLWRAWLTISTADLHWLLSVLIVGQTRGWHIERQCGNQPAHWEAVAGWEVTRWQPAQCDNQPAHWGVAAHQEVMHCGTMAAKLQWTMAATAQWMAKWWLDCDGWWWRRWVTEGVTMGDGNGGSKIVIGDNGGGAMDGGMAMQLWWQLPWMAVVAIGDCNGGGTIAMDEGGWVPMDDGTAAQSLCAASWLQRTMAAEMGNGGETVAIDNGGNIATDGGMAAQLWWVMVAVMGDSGCHNGLQQQRQHNCNGRQC